MLIGINVNKSFIILVLMIILYSFKRPNNYVFFFCEALGKSSMLVFFIINLFYRKIILKKKQILKINLLILHVFNLMKL